MVHVLLKEALELVADKESFWSVIPAAPLPNQVLLADRRQSLVFWSI